MSRSQTGRRCEDPIYCHAPCGTPPGCTGPRAMASPSGRTSSGTGAGHARTAFRPPGTRAGVSPRGEFVKQVFDRPSVTPSAIVIVGSGVVGTATGEGFLELGHDVSFVDISERRVRELQERGLNASTTVGLPEDRSAFSILTLPT